jgi:hypothetical protein
MGGPRNTYGRNKKCTKKFIRKPEGKRPLGRTISKWEDDIRTNVGEIGWEIVDCIDVTQNRDQMLVLVGTVS